MLENIPPGIPTEPVWNLYGRTANGDIRHWEIFHSDVDAQKALERIEGERSDLAFEVTESIRIIPDRTLPNEAQRKGLGELMHRAFVAVRFASYHNESDVAAEIADVFHNMPMEIYQDDQWDWNYYESCMKRLADKNVGCYATSMYEMLREIRANA